MGNGRKSRDSKGSGETHLSMGAQIMGTLTKTTTSIQISGSKKTKNCPSECTLGRVGAFSCPSRIRRLSCGHNDVWGAVCHGMFMRGCHTAFWHRSKDCIRVCALLAEFFGTAILVFVLSFLAAFTTNFVTTCSASPAEMNILLMLQLIIMGLGSFLLLVFLIEMFKAQSGAYFNPGLTIYSLLIGKLGFKTSVAYFFTQLLGGIFGALFVWLFFSCHHHISHSCLGTPQIGDGVSVCIALFAESVAGAILFVCVTYSVNHASNTAVSIGACLGVIHLVLLFVSGASVNFARYLGPAIFSNCWKCSHAWIYVVSNLVLSPIMAAIYYWVCCYLGMYDDPEKKPVEPALQA